nr:hypothetical protein GCM10020093_077090 [Planobispora longispora]
MKRTHVTAALLALAVLGTTAGTAGAAAAATPDRVVTQAQTQVPPINEAALGQAIAGLPAPDATAAEVRVGGSAGSWHGVSGVRDLRTGRPARRDAVQGRQRDEDVHHGRRPPARRRG